MRILFTSTAGLGHLYPLLPLARAARDARHRVLFAVPGGAVDVVRRHGHPAVVSSDGESPREAGQFWSQLPLQAEPNTYVFAGLFGRMRTQAALRRTRSVVEDFGPDLVVSECLEFAGSLVAEQLGVPQVAVGIGPLGLPDLSTDPLVKELNRFRAALGLPGAERPPWEVQPFATWVPDLLQHTSLEGIGPVTRYRYEDAEPGEVPIHWAPGDRKSVYATLGSAAPAKAGAGGIYRAVLDGLANCDVEVLFSVGTIDPAMLGPIPANVTVTGYAPHAVAMRRDAVISHGGCGTTVATLFHGRPTVAVPLFADQPHNARRLADLGLGTTVPVEHLAEQLPTAVQSVLTDPDVAGRAGKVRAAMLQVPTADQVLEELLLAGAAAR